VWLCGNAPPCLFEFVVVLRCPPRLFKNVWLCSDAPPCLFKFMVVWRCPPCLFKNVWLCGNAPPTSLHLQTHGCVAVPPRSHQKHVVVWPCPPMSPLTHGCVAVPLTSLLSCVCAAIEPHDCLLALYCVFVSRIVPKLLKTKCGIG
jgi:hypothetical protein